MVAGTNLTQTTTSIIDQSSSTGGINLLKAITMNAGTNLTQTTTSIIDQSSSTGGINLLKAITMNAGTNLTQTTTSIIDQSSSTGGINLLKAITMNANTNFLQSGTGVLSQTGTGINLMKNITQNTDCNLLQSGIGVITQTGTGTNALKGTTFSANNTHYNGSAIIQYDSTNTNYTQLSQVGTAYFISNTGSNIIAFIPTNLTIYTTSDFRNTSTYQSGAKVCLFESTNTDQTRLENLSTGFAITTEKQNGVINFNCYDGGFVSQNVLSLTDSTIQAKKNITLPTTQTTQTSGQLGYIHQGTILSVSSPATMNSGQVYYLASMTLPVGVWNVFAQLAYVFTTGGNLTYENLSISTSATTISLDNCLAVQNISGTTGNNRLQRINGIFTSTGSTALYPTLQVGYSTGPVPQYTTTSQTYVRFYAVRIA
jgi:hypothetical protein